MPRDRGRSSGALETPVETLSKLAAASLALNKQLLERRTYSVEFKTGGFTQWETVKALSADEARGIVNRTYGDAHICGVSLVK